MTVIVAMLATGRCRGQHALDPHVAVAPHHPFTIQRRARHAVGRDRAAFVLQHGIEIGGGHRGQ
ncbi:hypothetical protein QZM59_33555 [Burkholderia cenocepacia]|nr:hypothetical protein [Burkholderia cenocepacia]MDN7645909.1 hypothetical protein [Burkholderia cenocepacia]